MKRKLLAFGFLGMGVLALLATAAFSGPFAPGVVAAAAATPPAPPAPPDPPAAPAPPAPPHHHSHGDHGGAWLGVVLDGIRIVDVMEGSAAEEAGLRSGDRIQEIDGDPTDHSGDISRAIRRFQPGDSIRILVERDGEQVSVNATLGERDHFITRRIVIDDGDGERVIEHFEGPGVFLGIEIQSMSDDLREYFNAPRGVGVLVDRVMEDSPAEASGLRAGDVVIRVDGKDVSHHGDIMRALKGLEEGDRVAVVVVRDGSEKTFDVTLREWSGESRHGFFAPGISIDLGDFDNAYAFKVGDFDWDFDMDTSFDFGELERLGDNGFAFWGADGGGRRLTEEERAQIRETIEKAMEKAREAMEKAREEMERQLERNRALEPVSGEGYEI